MGPLSEKERHHRGKKVDRLVGKATEHGVVFISPDGTIGRRTGDTALNASSWQKDSGEEIRRVVSHGETVFTSRRVSDRLEIITIRDGGWEKGLRGLASQA